MNRNNEEMGRFLKSSISEVFTINELYQLVIANCETLRVRNFPIERMRLTVAGENGKVLNDRKQTFSAVFAEEEIH